MASRRRSSATPVYVEVGKKRTFVSARDWPGWCRVAKDEEAALTTLADYGPRYAVVAAEAGIDFPATVADRFDVVEHLPGDASTDFGAPGAVAAGDGDPLSPAEARRQAALLEAAWAVFDRVVAGAPATLAKGPRGGGRDRDPIVDHVVGAEAAYARKIGIAHKAPSGADAEAVAALRTEILEAVRDPELRLATPVEAVAGPVRPPPHRLARARPRLGDRGQVVIARRARVRYGPGTTAVITGGAGAIGSALAAELARRGVTVVLADVDGVAAEAAAARLGDGVHGEALDVRDGEAFLALVDGVEARHGPLDVLVNNAGVGVAGPVEGLSPEHWHRSLDVNVGGVVNGVAAVYPRMRARGTGQIVNMASVAGLLPLPLLVPYATTKHAVVGLSTSLRAEAAGTGVRVTVVCPSAVRTPMLARAVPEGLPDPSAPESVDPARYLTAGGSPPATTPEALAAEVVEGMARDRAVIVVPRAARRLWLLGRLAPGTFLRISARNATIERRRALDR